MPATVPHSVPVTAAAQKVCPVATMQMRPSLSVDSHVIEGVDLLEDVSTGVFRTVVGRTPLATTLNSTLTALVSLPEDLLLPNFS
jgi:hypothetical protein